MLSDPHSLLSVQRAREAMRPATAAAEARVDVK